MFNRICLKTVVVLLLLGLPPAMSFDPKVFRIYADKKNHFSISFPSRWNTRSDSFVELVAAPQQVLKTTKEFPNLKVVSRTLPDGMTLQSLSDTSLAQWKKIWTVVSDKNEKIAGKDARLLTIKQDLDLPGLRLKSEVIKMFIVGNDRYYVVTCASTEKDFDKDKIDFDEIIHSFKTN